MPRGKTVAAKGITDQDAEIRFKDDQKHLDGIDARCRQLVANFDQVRIPLIPRSIQPSFDRLHSHRVPSVT